MSELDNTSSLYEHIKNRLPTGFGLGDDGTEIIDNVPDHKTFQQSVREDHEGDVGIFVIENTPYSVMAGQLGYEAQIQFGVVTRDSDIDSAVKYLEAAYNNIKSNRKSSGVYVADSKLVSIYPVGKNSVGFQMVSMYIKLKYVLLN